jgi:hypothetical protein
LTKLAQARTHYESHRVIAVSAGDTGYVTRLRRRFVSAGCGGVRAAGAGVPLLRGTPHAASWKIKAWTHYKVAEDAGGIHVSTLRFEDRHLELAADVAEVLPVAATTIGEYYGRTEATGSLRAIRTDVGTRIRGVLPQVKAALGRPNN